MSVGCLGCREQSVISLVGVRQHFLGRVEEGAQGQAATKSWVSPGGTAHLWASVFPSAQ